MDDNKWIHIEHWMGKVLGLRANELICFALIYSFSRDGESQFKGTLNYLAQCMFATEPTALSVLTKLYDVHLINKEDAVINGKRRCFYSTNVLYDEGKIIVVDSTKEPLVMTTKESLVMTTKEPLVNNNNIYSKEKRLSKNNQKVTDELFETFWSLYDYKKGKDKALKSWKRLKKDEKEKAIKCIPEYKEDCRRNSRQMKHPSTFLNQKTWEDDFSCDGMVKVTEEQNEPDAKWMETKKWLDCNVPMISNGISPTDIAIMKTMTKSSQQLAKILVEINNTCPDGDIMSNFKRILHEQA